MARPDNRAAKSGTVGILHPSTVHSTALAGFFKPVNYVATLGQTQPPRIAGNACLSALRASPDAFGCLQAMS